MAVRISIACVVLNATLSEAVLYGGIIYPLDCPYINIHVMPLGCYVALFMIAMFLLMSVYTATKVAEKLIT